MSLKKQKIACDMSMQLKIIDKRKWAIKPSKGTKES